MAFKEAENPDKKNNWRSFFKWKFEDSNKTRNELMQLLAENRSKFENKYFPPKKKKSKSKRYEKFYKNKQYSYVGCTMWTSCVSTENKS